MSRPAGRGGRRLCCWGAILRPMPEKEGKAWYKKGAVQAAFVAGIVTAALTFFRPEPPPQIVVLQAQPQPVSVPVSGPPAPAEAPPDSSNSSQRSVSKERKPPQSVGVVSSAEPSTSGPSNLLDLPKRLVPDQPWFLSNLTTAITATFRETLGSRYVEITIAAPEATTRFPARSAGASGRFSAGGSFYEVQVLSIDWESSVNVMVRAVPGP